LFLLSPVTGFAEGKKALVDQFLLPVTVEHEDKTKHDLVSTLLFPVAQAFEYEDGFYVYQISFRTLSANGESLRVIKLGVFNSGPKSQNYLAEVVPLDALDLQQGNTSKFAFLNNPNNKNEIRASVGIGGVFIDNGVKREENGYIDDVVFKFDWKQAQSVIHPNKPKPIDKNKDENQKPLKRDIKIKVNGEFIHSEVKPFIENERTMVPLRFIAEALKIKIEWNQEKREVLIVDGNKNLKLPINSNKITVNDTETIEIDSPAILKSDRTFVPLRAIAEIFGAKVDWENETSTVIIEKK
ncbi:MAG: copper amine oxidase N-terminal domain-containing protein, partial [Tissierellia bacterium]|nr:copper amine oxidase N-terminal domain-containing protein [Tissierellia bacterium]